MDFIVLVTLFNFYCSFRVHESSNDQGFVLGLFWVCSGFVLCTSRSNLVYFLVNSQNHLKLLKFQTELMIHLSKYI